MRYNKKYVLVPDEYQGESFTRSLLKDSAATWAATEVANYEMRDTDGAVKSSGSLDKSADNLAIIVQIPKADTASLEGNYVIYVNLEDTDDATKSDIIAEYNITYKLRKAKA